MRSNWRTLSRLAAVLVLATIAAAPLASMCAGWSSVAVERMACCKAARHHCESTISDDCCAAGEQRQNVNVTVPFVLLPAVALCLGPVSASPTTAARIPERTAPTFPTPLDTYLFGTAFLI